MEARTTPYDGDFLAPVVNFALRHPVRVLLIVMVAHVVVWTLLPLLTAGNLELDLAEDLALGKEWQLGYWKHPPLPWWMADLVYRLTGQIESVYGLGPLAVIGCFIAVYLLARDIAGPVQALIATLSLVGIHYYNYSAVKFAHDQMQLPFWALTALFFYRGLVRGRALDIVDGATEEFTAEGVRFHGTRIDSKLFPWSEIAALFVESLGGAEAAKPAAAPDVPVTLDLAGGSRVRGVLKSCAQEKLVIAALAGQTLEFPFALVRQLFVDDGAARYLSELTPSSAAASRPFGDDLGLTWPHRVDQSVTGRPLTAGGRVFPHGFGVHAPSKLVWKLAGGFTKLRGRVAVDDEVLGLGARGSVVFRVLLDGKKMWESAVLHGGDAPVAFPAIELGTASELTLEVDPGADSFVADRADWLDVMLVK